MTEKLPENIDEQEDIKEPIVEGADTNDNEKKVVMTQEELNELITERLKRQSKKFADYDELKAQAESLRKQQEQAERERMTEQERLQADLENAKEQARIAQEQAEAMSKANNALLIRQAFETAAVNAGVKYVEDAYKLTVERNENVQVVDGVVQGIDEVISDITANKTYLLSPARPIGKPMGQTGEVPKRTATDELEELRRKAIKTGRSDDRIAYSKKRRELGLA